MIDEIHIQRQRGDGRCIAQIGLDRRHVRQGGQRRIVRILLTPNEIVDDGHTVARPLGQGAGDMEAEKACGAGDDCMNHECNLFRK